MAILKPKLVNLALHHELHSFANLVDKSNLLFALLERVGLGEDDVSHREHLIEGRETFMRKRVNQCGGTVPPKLAKLFL